MSNFEASLQEDFKAFGLRPTDLEALKKPYAYDRVVDSLVVLKPGKSVGNGRRPKRKSQLDGGDW